MRETTSIWFAKGDNANNTSFISPNMGDVEMSAGPFPAFLAAWIQIIVPQPCFDKFFVDFDFLNGKTAEAMLSFVFC